MLRYRSKNFPSSRSEQNEKIASKLSNALSWTVNTTYLGFATAPVLTSVLYIAITNQVSSRVSTQHTAWQFSDIAFSYRLELFWGAKTWKLHCNVRLLPQVQYVLVVQYIAACAPPSASRPSLSAQVATLKELQASLGGKESSQKPL